MRRVNVWACGLLGPHAGKGNLCYVGVMQSQQCIAAGRYVSSFSFSLAELRSAPCFVLLLSRNVVFAPSEDGFLDSCSGSLFLHPATCESGCLVPSMAIPCSRAICASNGAKLQAKLHAANPPCPFHSSSAAPGLPEKAKAPVVKFTEPRPRQRDQQPPFSAQTGKVSSQRG